MIVISLKCNEIINSSNIFKYSLKTMKIYALHLLQFFNNPTWSLPQLSRILYITYNKPPKQLQTPISLVDSHKGCQNVV